MQTTQRAHSHRIIGSAVYDGLIILGLLMLAGFIAVLVNKWLTGQESIQHRFLFQLYILTIVTSYFLYFWKKSGQTVGMKAWRIKLVNIESGRFTYKQLLLRLIVAIPAYACLGLGVFWQYINQQHLNWHDMASRSKLIYLPKP